MLLQIMTWLLIIVLGVFSYWDINRQKNHKECNHNHTRNDSLIFTGIIGHTYLSGIELIEDASLQIPISVTRSFWERVFSLHPFVKTKIIGYKSCGYYYHKGDKVIMAPVDIEKVKKQIDERNGALCT